MGSVVANSDAISFNLRTAEKKVTHGACHLMDSCVKFRQVWVHALSSFVETGNIRKFEWWHYKVVEGIQTWYLAICTMLWFSCHFGVLHNLWTCYFDLRHFPLQNAFLLRRGGSALWATTSSDPSFHNVRWENQRQLRLISNMCFLS